VPMTDRAARPGVLADAEHLVTRAHAEAVDGFCGPIIWRARISASLDFTDRRCCIARSRS
jgi:hypothetical protein